MSDRWGSPSTRSPPPASGADASGSFGPAATWRTWGTGFTRNCDEYDMIEKIGEGTYGQVYKARHRRLGHLVAMKKMRIHSDAQGFPLTAVREVKILKKLTHVNMVALKEVITSRGSQRIFDDDDDEEETAKRGHGDIFVVLEYVDHDLTGLLDERYVFQPDEVKCVMKQLLEVLKYLHEEKFVHRDLKCSNLLLAHDGTLKLADFGLARSIEPTYTGPTKTLDRLTNNVITLWYRPPELLLGLNKYGTPVDMWSAGCILAELILRKPLFPGKSELEQLDLIFRVLGTPTPSTWPQHESLPRFAALQPKEPYVRALEDRYADRFAACNKHALSLTVHLLNLDPSRRRTAKAALELPFFAGVQAHSRHPLRVKEGAAFHEWKTKEARRRARAQAERNGGSSPGGGGNGGDGGGATGGPGGHGGPSGNGGHGGHGSHAGPGGVPNPWNVSADDLASLPSGPPPGPSPRLPPGLPPRLSLSPAGSQSGLPLSSASSVGLVNDLIARRAGLPGLPPAAPASSLQGPRSHGAPGGRRDSVDMDESPQPPGQAGPTGCFSPAHKRPGSRGRTPPPKPRDSRGGHDTDDFLANFVDDKPPTSSYVYGQGRARCQSPPTRQAPTPPGDITDELAAMLASESPPPPARQGRSLSVTKLSEAEAVRARETKASRLVPGPGTSYGAVGSGGGSRGGGSGGGGSGGGPRGRSGGGGGRASSSSGSSSSSSRSRSPSRGRKSKPGQEQTRRSRSRDHRSRRRSRSRSGERRQRQEPKHRDQSGSRSGGHGGGHGGGGGRSRYGHSDSHRRSRSRSRSWERGYRR